MAETISEDSITLDDIFDALKDHAKRQGRPQAIPGGSATSPLAGKDGSQG